MAAFTALGNLSRRSSAGGLDCHWCLVAGDLWRGADADELAQSVGLELSDRWHRVLLGEVTMKNPWISMVI